MIQNKKNKFLSICIPNYNYAEFIKKTINSVLSQDTNDFEILVSDNCSTDKSVKEINSFNDERIKLTINKKNIGFAPNLNRACKDASGDRMILLSSDDVVYEGAFNIYKKIDQYLGEKSAQTIFCSAQNIIDENDNIIKKLGFLERVWRESTLDENLSELIGVSAYRIPSKVLLSNSLKYLCNPFSFCTTCYSRDIYDKAEGYPSGYFVNPDKAFHYRILALTHEVIYVDYPLFGYRVHNTNKTSISTNISTLKLLIDQYRHTLDTDEFILNSSFTNKNNLIKAFVKYDIALKSLELIAQNKRDMAIRYFNFGKSVYPKEVSKSFLVYVLMIFIILGPIGNIIASLFYKGFLRKFKSGNLFSL